MPQMAPLSWLSLFILFSIIFIMFCMLNYFSFMNPIIKSTSQQKLSNKSMNWKW